jgi:hypothetical protein
MFANIFGKKNFVKSLLISTLGKAIYYKGTFLQHLSLQHKTGRRPAEKIALFQHASF